MRLSDPRFQAVAQSDYRTSALPIELRWRNLKYSFRRRLGNTPRCSDGGTGGKTTPLKVRAQPVAQGVRGRRNRCQP